jgi:hypothetical protein
VRQCGVGVAWCNALARIDMCCSADLGGTFQPPTMLETRTISLLQGFIQIHMHTFVESAHGLLVQCLGFRIFRFSESRAYALCIGTVLLLVLPEKDATCIYNDNCAVHMNQRLINEIYGEQGGVKGDR